MLFLKICKGNPIFTVSLLIVSAYILIAILAPYIIPLDLTGKNPPYLPPSFQHPFGTDHIGRDIFMQIAYGSRDVLLLAAIGAGFTILFATFGGALAGIYGGIVDTILTIIIDVMLTIPSLPLQIVIAASIRGAGNPIILGLVLAITSWAAPARSIRSQVMSIKSRDFIEASRCLGVPKIKILISDILPIIMPYIMVCGLISFISAIYSIVGLAMIGVIPWSEMNWGVMINIAANYTPALLSFRGIWYLLAPLIAIVVLQLAIVGLSNTIEVIFNPRLRERYETK